MSKAGMIARAAIAATSALALGWMGLAMTKSGLPADPGRRSTTPRPISVRLLESANAISGMEVPKGLADQSGDYLRVQEPADVTLQLPGDRTIRMRVKYVSVFVDHGVVADVNLLPLPKSVPFREAVAELRRLLKEMDITPDERMRKEMATWPDESNSFSYRTGVKLSDSVDLMVDVRPATDGYFLTLTFSAIGDARRAVWDPTFKPATKPAAGAGKDEKPDRASGQK